MIKIYLEIEFYFKIIQTNFNNFKSKNNSLYFTFYELNYININKLEKLINYFIINNTYKYKNKYGSKIGIIKYHLNYNKKIKYINDILNDIYLYDKFVKNKCL